jgi:phosphoglycerol transferase MdoB-like AlkP superfamily enzyme
MYHILQLVYNRLQIYKGGAALKKFSLRLSLPVSYILLVLSSIVITVFIFFIRSNTNTDVWNLILESNGMTFLLNWLPVLLTTLAVFFMTARVVAAAGLSAVLFIFPAVVNRYMIAMRHEPLQPLTFLLGAEFLGIAKSIKPAVFISVGAGITAFIVLAVFAFKLIKNDKPGTVARIAGTAGCIALCTALYLTAYADEGVYAGLPLQGNQYSETDQFQSKGFVYSFIHALHDSELKKPGFYDEYLPAVEKALTEANTAGQADKAASQISTGEPSQPYSIKAASLPNIIFVQSEAFSELAISDALDFDGFTDPLSNYKAIKEESLHGYLVSPHMGGGTSDMEFDVLTGLNTRHFRSVPYTFKMIGTPFTSIASVLKAQGYATVAAHPGAGWFYNRQNVYPLLGFDLFQDDSFYDVKDTKGLYITERQTIEKLLADFETRPQPQFQFCITIQNHGPYDGKYPIKGLNFNTELDMGGDGEMALANYFEGLKDSDEGLYRLVEHFKKTDKPVLLVYYGDHLPSFPLPLLMQLDPLANDAPDGEQLIKYNRVPFLIWANEAAKALVDTSAFEASLPADRTISPQYLGAAVLEMLGISGVDPFLDYVNGLRTDYPVILEETLRPGQSDIRQFDSAEDRPAAIYHTWEYYKVME